MYLLTMSVCGVYAVCRRVFVLWLGLGRQSGHFKEIPRKKKEVRTGVLKERTRTFRLESSVWRTSMECRTEHLNCHQNLYLKKLHVGVQLEYFWSAALAAGKGVGLHLN